MLISVLLMFFLGQLPTNTVADTIVKASPNRDEQMLDGIDFDTSATTEIPTSNQKVDGNKELQEINEEENNTKEPEENSIEPILTNDSETKGIWGTAEWAFNQATGEMKITNGELTDYHESLWQQGNISSSNIKSIEFIGIVKAPKNSSFLFEGLTNVVEIIGLLDTSEVTSIDYMFQVCFSLKRIDFLKTLYVTNINRAVGVFSACYNLSEIDLSHWENITLSENTFAACNSLEKLVLGSNISFMSFPEVQFQMPRPLYSGNVGIATGNWTKIDGTSKGYSPNDFITNWGTGDLTPGAYVAELDGGFRWGTSSVIFDSETGTLTIDEGELGESTTSPWNRKDIYEVDIRNIKKIVLKENIIAPQNAANLFVKTSNLDIVPWGLNAIEGLENLDTSNATDMSGMFDLLVSLDTLDLRSFDTTNVTSMRRMFRATRVRELNLESFDTSNVQSMNEMFSLSRISQLTLGEKFRFLGTSASLSSPYSTENVTGRWIKNDGTSSGYLPNDFMNNYGTGDLSPGTYIAEMKSFDYDIVLPEITLGNKLADFDLNTIITNVRFDDEELIPEEYELSITKEIETDIVGETVGEIQIAHKRNGLIQKIPLHIQKVNWGKALRFKGYDNMSVGTFIYHPELNKITPRWGLYNAHQQINLPEYGDNFFYSIKQFRASSNQFILDFEIPLNSISANGNDSSDIFMNQGKEWVTNIGDVLEVKHVQAAKDRLTMMIEEKEKPLSEQTYLELTKDGYRMLQLNQVKPVKTTINIGATEEELDTKINGFIDKTAAPDVELVGFVSYPDTSKQGESSGIIQIKEKLTTGKYVYQNYVVLFNVESTILELKELKNADFDFGSIKKSSHAQTLAAKGESAPSITISDYSESNSWELRVSQPEGLKDAQKNELSGAVIRLKNIQVVDSVHENILLPARNIELSSVQRSVARMVDHGGEKETGLTILQIGDSKDQTLSGIEMSIPRNTISNASTYQTTIEWELTGDPTLTEAKQIGGQDEAS
ncbi:hypothetical protein D920_02758 [Enterococcus faecalis 13-SD-W-01]|nr:hypothetical protein D920_02758 [Enterococcus faecalis 13-SD-W-01]